MYDGINELFTMPCARLGLAASSVLVTKMEKGDEPMSSEESTECKQIVLLF